MIETYIDYIQYYNEYKGVLIPSELFENFVMQASSKVNYYTFYRIRNVDNNVIFATCEIADLLYEQYQLKLKQNDDKLTISSETVGPHSKSYVNKTNLQAQRILSSQELENECYNICLKHLSKTGLMHRGI